VTLQYKFVCILSIFVHSYHFFAPKICFAFLKLRFSGNMMQSKMETLSCGNILFWEQRSDKNVQKWKECTQTYIAASHTKYGMCILVYFNINFFVFVCELMDRHKSNTIFVTKNYTHYININIIIK
jgi:hypothetical protein